MFKSSQNILTGVLWFTLFFMINSCRSHQTLIEPFEASGDDLMSLSQAVMERNVNQLLNFTEHRSEKIRGISWRALAVSEIENVNDLIKFALESNNPGAWFALTHQDLSSSDIQKISGRFLEGELPPDPVCIFFYRHGDETILMKLLSDADLLLNHPSCSKAAGSIITRVELDEKTIDDIAGLIFRLDDDIAVRNLLYGFWRTSLNRPNDRSTAYKMLIEMVYNRTANEPTLADEYLVRLTGTPGFDAVMYRRAESQLIKHTQLAVVTAFVLSEFEANKLNKQHVIRLINHPNPIVTARVLESLKQIEGLDIDWFTDIETEISHHQNNPEITIAWLELLHQNDIDLWEHRSILDSIDSEYPYLKSRTLPLYRHILDDSAYYRLLVENLQEEGIEALQATLALSELVENHPDPGLIAPHFRQVLLKALEDQNRSILSSAAPLMNSHLFFNNEDETLFLKAYEQALEQNERSVTQSLARAIEFHGFQVNVSGRELQAKTMRTPDWPRLQEMGENPLWILETNKGDIIIRLHPLEAPFTVSSIDHLTRSGFYEDVIFHRVVPNFVIQGGDFDRRDGFGGPDYRIPTEPSYDTFKRGMAGMASSGPDTEGSQFFITHTRTPHLDGLYTIFGEVIEGMDVVDRIQIGDRVLRARIETGN